MSEVATVMREAVEQAVRSAVSAYQFYMAAAEYAVGELARSSLESLAGDELTHARLLRGRSTAAGSTRPTLPSFRRHTPDDVRRLTAGLDAHLREPHDELSSLWLALQRQLASMQLYEAWAGSATIPEVKAFYEELAEWQASQLQTVRRQLEELRRDEFPPVSASQARSDAAGRGREITVVALPPTTRRRAHRRGHVRHAS